METTWQITIKKNHVKATFITVKLYLAEQLSKDKTYQRIIGHFYTYKNMYHKQSDNAPKGSYIIPLNVKRTGKVHQR